jgi:coproporphyrinogen III oxidase-like Fe-S oxidoreductase
MIDDDTLPTASERAEQARAAAAALVSSGNTRIGIDHFALPGDGLAIAAAAGRLHRNFQGYTSDTARTLSASGRLRSVELRKATSGTHPKQERGRAPSLRGSYRLHAATL